MTVSKRWFLIVVVVVALVAVVAGPCSASTTSPSQFLYTCCGFRMVAHGDSFLIVQRGNHLHPIVKVTRLPGTFQMSARMAQQYSQSLAQHVQTHTTLTDAQKWSHDLMRQMLATGHQSAFMVEVDVNGDGTPDWVFPGSYFFEKSDSHALLDKYMTLVRKLQSQFRVPVEVECDHFLQYAGASIMPLFSRIDLLPRPTAVSGQCIDVSLIGSPDGNLIVQVSRGPHPGATQKHCAEFKTSFVW